MFFFKKLASAINLKHAPRVFTSKTIKMKLVALVKKAVILVSHIQVFAILAQVGIY
jgi:hypothetical protein